MSAKRTQTVISVTLTQIALACACQLRDAATPEASTAAAGPRHAFKSRITREDADLMLREARGAIEQGRLDEAEKILSRVESAHVNYSVFHVGPTPASVRRELTRAQPPAGTRVSRPVRPPMPAARVTCRSLATATQKRMTTQDPFAARNQMTDQKAAAPTSPGADRSDKPRLALG